MPLISRDLLDALLLLGALQGFVLCVPLLRYRNNRVPNRILALLLLLLAFDLLCVYLNNSPVSVRYPALFDLNASFPFLFNPIIYAYVRVMTGTTPRFRLRHLPHAVPFLAHAVFSYFSYHGLDTAAKREIVSATRESGVFVDRLMFFLPRMGVRPDRWRLVAVAVLLLVASAYVVAIARRIARYRGELREYYSDVRNKVLGFLTFSLVAAASVWLLVTVVIVSGAANKAIPMLAYTVAVYVGTYSLMTVPEVFAGNRAMSDLLGRDADGAERDGAADDADDADDAVVNGETVARLAEYLAGSRPYLRPELTIGEVAGAVGIPVYRLSKALNRHLGKNFYQFVNEFRVAEAGRLLRDPVMAERSVLSIGMDAGFSSKSTFNDVFKKMTGLTPTDWRRRHASDESVASGSSDPGTSG